MIRAYFPLIQVFSAALVFATAPTHAAELLIGGATISITPDKPVGLFGQMNTRIATTVETPATATALALESRDGAKVLDQAIMVSCDLVLISKGVTDKVRERLRGRLENFDTAKLFLNATHTHSAPVTEEGIYDLARDGVMQPTEYVEFLADRVAEVAAKAWQGRKPGQVGWGLGHAVVGQNRRAVYSDGKAQMYGKTNRSDFRNFEGPEDHGVEVLFFWNREGQLVATAVNVACPSQEVEHSAGVNADFWHEIRESLRAKYGKDLLVLGWTGAAGDQSPHLMYRDAAEERMRKLRGVSRLQEIANRVVAAWEEAYAGARQEMKTDVPLVHKVQTIELPRREVSREESVEAAQRVQAQGKDPKNLWRVAWHQGVVDRFNRQQAGPVEPYKMELHVIRLGDVAIATNDFELFTDFGIEIKTRSPALQTFVIQLAGPGTYVPTQKAVAGGGYSAVPESSEVGPGGGQALVERTVEAIQALWSGN